MEGKSARWTITVDSGLSRNELNHQIIEALKNLDGFTPAYMGTVECHVVAQELSPNGHSFTILLVAPDLLRITGFLSRDAAWQAVEDVFGGTRPTPKADQAKIDALGAKYWAAALAART